MMMKIIGILVGFLVVLSACSSKKDSNELPADWKKYGTANFEISFPKNWKINEKPQAGVLFNILAPLDTKTVRRWRAFWSPNPPFHRRYGAAL